MEISQLISTIFGNSLYNKRESLAKQKFNARFYIETDEDAGDTIFCKNNVSIKIGEKHFPGYLTVKACSINQEFARLVLHWTSNEQLQENTVTEDLRPLTEIEHQGDQEDESFPSVFHIDLTEMKSLKFFFTDGQSSGHFVIGNHENHYKVFHFDLGGMNHLSEIFDNWRLCKPVKLPAEEKSRKKCFTVVPIYSIQPNQSFEESRYSPMTKPRWEMFFNSSGQLEDVANFRKEVFFGGILPEVRHEAWKFLLHYYPFHSRASERKNIKVERTKEYSDLNKRRLNMPKQEYNKFWLSVQCTVDKDVVRTDRSHPYFAGNDNPNVEIMRKILLNYAYYQPEVGYNQGMSDLLASILCTVQDEVDAFWCFVGLMEKSLFVTSPRDDSMDCQLLYLKELLRMMAVKFYAHLLLEDEGMDLLFCHRWLLLGFKREFHNMPVMRMWEACWSHYQTEYFHIFLCVAIVLEYGDDVWKRSMRVDETLNYFNNMALQMDGDRVLRKARGLLHQFRQLSGIPCTLRGLLSGPGAWDSATLPDIECTCHDWTASTCKYSTTLTRGRSQSKGSPSDSDERQKDGEESHSEFEERETDGEENGLNFKKQHRNNTNGNANLGDNDELNIELDFDKNQVMEEIETDEFDDTSGQEYETCPESPNELAVEMNEMDEVVKSERGLPEGNEGTTRSVSGQIYDVGKTDTTRDETQIELYVSQ